jgi:uncharacterized protein YeaO (DUF488 family)
MKDMALSEILLNRFANDPAKWDKFCRRYFAELDSQSETWQIILATSLQGSVNLHFGATDIRHNNPVELKVYLEACHSSGGK